MHSYVKYVYLMLFIIDMFRRRGYHHQGDWQDYKESKHTVTTHKWTTRRYKACLKLLT